MHLYVAAAYILLEFFPQPTANIFADNRDQQRKADCEQAEKSESVHRTGIMGARAALGRA